MSNAVDGVKNLYKRFTETPTESAVNKALDAATFFAGAEKAQEIRDINTATGGALDAINQANQLATMNINVNNATNAIGTATNQVIQNNAVQQALAPLQNIEAVNKATDFANAVADIIQPQTVGVADVNIAPLSIGTDIQPITTPVELPAVGVLNTPDFTDISTILAPSPILTPQIESNIELANDTAAKKVEDDIYKQKILDVDYKSNHIKDGTQGIVDFFTPEYKKNQGSSLGLTVSKFLGESLATVYGLTKGLLTSQADKYISPVLIVSKDDVVGLRDTAYGGSQETFKLNSEIPSDFRNLQVVSENAAIKKGIDDNASFLMSELSKAYLNGQVSKEDYNKVISEFNITNEYKKVFKSPDGKGFDSIDINSYAKFLDKAAPSITDFYKVSAEQEAKTKENIKKSLTTSELETYNKLEKDKEEIVKKGEISYNEQLTPYIQKYTSKGIPSGQILSYLSQSELVNKSVFSEIGDVTAMRIALLKGQKGYSEMQEGVNKFSQYTTEFQTLKTKYGLEHEFGGAAQGIDSNTFANQSATLEFALKYNLITRQEYDKPTAAMFDRVSADVSKYMLTQSFPEKTKDGKQIYNFGKGLVGDYRYGLGDTLKKVVSDSYNFYSDNTFNDKFQRLTGVKYDKSKGNNNSPILSKSTLDDSEFTGKEFDNGIVKGFSDVSKKSGIKTAEFGLQVGRNILENGFEIGKYIKENPLRGVALSTGIGTLGIATYNILFGDAKFSDLMTLFSEPYEESIAPLTFMAGQGLRREMLGEGSASVSSLQGLNQADIIKSNYYQSIANNGAEYLPGLLDIGIAYGTSQFVGGGLSKVGGMFDETVGLVRAAKNVNSVDDLVLQGTTASNVLRARKYLGAVVKEGVENSIFNSVLESKNGTPYGNNESIFDLITMGAIGYATIGGLKGMRSGNDFAKAIGGVSTSSELDNIVGGLVKNSFESVLDEAGAIVSKDGKPVTKLKEGSFLYQLKTAGFDIGGMGLEQSAKNTFMLSNQLKVGLNTIAKLENKAILDILVDTKAHQNINESLFTKESISDMSRDIISMTEDITAGKLTDAQKEMIIRYTKVVNANVSEASGLDIMKKLYGEVEEAKKSPVFIIERIIPTTPEGIMKTKLSQTEFDEVMKNGQAQGVDASGYFKKEGDIYERNINTIGEAIVKDFTDKFTKIIDNC